MKKQGPWVEEQRERRNWIMGKSFHGEQQALDEAATQDEELGSL